MYVFIVNTSAGNGRALLLWGIIEKKLQYHKLDYTVLISKSDAATQAFMLKQIQSYQPIVVGVIGGDGTTNSVIQSIAGTSIPIAILPTGSGNDTAREFHLTDQPDVFFKGMLTNKTVPIDLLNVNNRYGVTIAGIGIDAAIGHQADHSFYKPILNKLGIGSFAYTIAAISGLITYKPFGGQITIDGTYYKLDESWLIACGNTTSYGGGLVVCPQALPTDGVMNITMLHNVKRLTVLFRLFPALLKGNVIHHKGVSYKTGKQLDIETDRPILIVIDGEISTSTKLCITIQEKALRLILTT